MAELLEAVAKISGPRNGDLRTGKIRYLLLTLLTSSFYKTSLNLVIRNYNITLINVNLFFNPDLGIIETVGRHYFTIREPISEI